MHPTLPLIPAALISFDASLSVTAAACTPPAYSAEMEEQLKVGGG